MSNNAQGEERDDMGRKKRLVSGIVCISFCLCLLTTQATEGIQLAAHRGGGMTEKENTLVAIKHVMEQPIRCIEIDVQLTKDRQVVLFHDETVGQGAEEARPLYTLTYAQILQRDGEIPTLRSALKLTKGKMPLLIELKAYGLREALIEKVIEDLKRYKMLDQVEICSFDRDLMIKLKHKEPTLKVGLITSYSEKAMAEKELDFVSLQYKAATEEIVDLLHQRGKRVYVWTVNQKEDMRLFHNMGVDLIITDRPLELKTP